MVHVGAHCHFVLHVIKIKSKTITPQNVLRDFPALVKFPAVEFALHFCGIEVVFFLTFDGLLVFLLDFGIKLVDVFISLLDRFGLVLFKLTLLLSLSLFLLFL